MNKFAHFLFRSRGPAVEAGYAMHSLMGRESLLLGSMQNTWPDGAANFKSTTLLQTQRIRPR